jgi:hypothetical protein
MSEVLETPIKKKRVTKKGQQKLADAEKAILKIGYLVTAHVTGTVITGTIISFNRNRVRLNTGNKKKKWVRREHIF